jgi:hypothetical protein
MGRPSTRTWQATPATAAPVARVQDPAVRAILLTTARALAMIVAAIRKHCGDEEGEAEPP